MFSLYLYFLLRLSTLEAPGELRAAELQGRLLLPVEQLPARPVADQQLTHLQPLLLGRRVQRRVAVPSAAPFRRHSHSYTVNNPITFHCIHSSTNECKHPRINSSTDLSGQSTMRLSLPSSIFTTSACPGPEAL